MINLYLTLFVVNVFSVGDIKFSWDQAMFYSDTVNLRLVEFYYSIPWSELLYKTRGETILAEYKTELRINNRDGSDSFVDIKDNRYNILSFTFARQHDLQVLDKYSLFLPPGQYLYSFTVICSTKTGRYEGGLAVVPDSGRLFLSSILLALNIKADSQPGKFGKNKLVIIPNPSNIYGGNYSTLYGYMELYSSPDLGDYRITYNILKPNGDTVKKAKRTMPKISGNQTHAWDISIADLTIGDYTFVVEVNDLSTGISKKQNKNFSIRKKETGFKVEGLEKRKYYDLIKFLVSEKEYKKFRKFSEVGQAQYLKSFWQRNDYEEFERRVDYTNERFSVGGKKGLDTDRGRIYVKYGPPDETEAHSFETGYKPNEHWRYFSSGLYFIFVDIRGNGDYLLIYSKTDHERRDPNWENYINPEELQY